MMLVVYLRVFFVQLPNLGFSQHQISLITQSKEAYETFKNDDSAHQRTERAQEGFIVTETESENSEALARLCEPLCESGRMLISRRRKAICRQKQRLRAKAIAQRRLLSRKKSERVSKLLSECTDIGKVIEDFVSSNNVGADSWRRTGVLTFDGNTRLPQKVTYSMSVLGCIWKRFIND